MKFPGRNDFRKLAPGVSHVTAAAVSPVARPASDRPPAADMPGDVQVRRLDLLQDWLDGQWDDGKFLHVPAGHYVKADYRGGIVKAVSPDQYSEDNDE